MGAAWSFFHFQVPLMHQPQVAVIFHRLGPYHWARLDAAGRKLDLLVIEEATDSAEYAWDKVEGESSFRRVTLFGPGEGEVCQRREMRSRIWAVLDRERPAVVAVPGWTDPAALAAILWATRPGARRTPVVMMSESTVLDAPRAWWKEWIKRRIVAQCGAGLAGGTRQMEYLGRLGMPVDHIFTGYGVVDNEHFAFGAAAARRDAKATRARLGLPERYFLACNRFVPKKNLSTLLEAYTAYVREVKANFEAPPWDLVLIGDGPLREALQEQASALGVGPHVHFPGFQQYDVLPAYYGLAGAFVHVSTSEQWGLVVNEAMSSGLPVMVSDPCGCVPDLVVEGCNGFVVQSHDVPNITECLGRLAGDPDERRRMGEASREIIQPWSVHRFTGSLRGAVESARRATPSPAGALDRLLLRALLRA